MGLTELGCKILNAYSEEDFRMHPDTIAEYLRIDFDDVEYELENLSREGFIKLIRGQSGGCVINGLEPKGRISLKDPDRFMKPENRYSEFKPQINIGSVVDSKGVNYNSANSKATTEKDSGTSKEGISRYIPKEFIDIFLRASIVIVVIIILWKFGLKDKIPDLLGKLL
jgi:hypothetical protein